MTQRIDFSHITTWVFDLDNTLYPPEIRLFDQISEKMVQFMVDHLNIDHATANKLRTRYWESHGTTLAGLMDVHGVPPEQFLIDVHDIDFSALPPAPGLAALINTLPGRKIVYTNGTVPYAQNVLRARGLDHCFPDIFGVENAGFRPKPEYAAFETVFAQAQITPTSAAMFEDEMRNLQAPHQMGLRTVWVAPQAGNPAPAPFVDMHHHTLDAALQQIIAGGFTPEN